MSLDSDSHILVQALAFHSSLKGGRTSGQLFVSSAALTFNGGGEVVNFPLDGLVVTTGGSNNRLYFFAHPQFPEWSLCTPDRGAIEALLSIGNPSVLKQIHTIRTKRTQLSAGAFVGIILFIALLFGVWESRHFVAGYLAQFVPAEWEKKVGEVVYTASFADKEVNGRDGIQSRLEQLVEPLVEAASSSGYNFEFHIIKESTLNAFALPGGTIVIHSGLIERAERAEELLGVLAHEIAHVTERHVTKQLISAMGVYFAFDLLVGNIAGVLAQVSDLAPMLLTQKFSRDFERDADRQGFQFLQAAEIDPSGLTTFFKRMHEEEQSSIVGQINDSLAIISTHPATPERIEFLETELAKMQSTTYRSFGSEFEELKSLLRAAVEHRKSTSPADESNQEEEDQ